MSRKFLDSVLEHTEKHIRVFRAFSSELGSDIPQTQKIKMFLETLYGKDMEKTISELKKKSFGKPTNSTTKSTMKSTTNSTTNSTMKSTMMMNDPEPPAKKAKTSDPSDLPLMLLANDVTAFNILKFTNFIIRMDIYDTAPINYDLCFKYEGNIEIDSIVEVSVYIDKLKRKKVHTFNDNQYTEFWVGDVFSQWPEFTKSIYYRFKNDIQRRAFSFGIALRVAVRSRTTRILFSDVPNFVHTLKMYDKCYLQTHSDLFTKTDSTLSLKPNIVEFGYAPGQKQPFPVSDLDRQILKKVERVIAGYFSQNTNRFSGGLTQEHIDSFINCIKFQFTFDDNLTTYNFKSMENLKILVLKCVERTIGDKKEFVLENFPNLFKIFLYISEFRTNTLLRFVDLPMLTRARISNINPIALSDLNNTVVFENCNKLRILNTIGVSTNVQGIDLLPLRRLGISFKINHYYGDEQINNVRLFKTQMFKNLRIMSVHFVSDPQIVELQSFPNATIFYFVYSEAEEITINIQNSPKLKQVVVFHKSPQPCKGVVNIKECNKLSMVQLTEGLDLHYDKINELELLSMHKFNQMTNNHSFGFGVGTLLPSNRVHMKILNVVHVTSLRINGYKFTRPFELEIETNRRTENQQPETYDLTLINVEKVEKLTINDHGERCVSVNCIGHAPDSVIYNKTLAPTTNPPVNFIYDKLKDLKIEFKPEFVNVDVTYSISDCTNVDITFLGSPDKDKKPGFRMDIIDVYTVSVKSKLGTYGVYNVNLVKSLSMDVFMAKDINVENTTITEINVDICRNIILKNSQIDGPISAECINCEIFDCQGYQLDNDGDVAMTKQDNSDISIILTTRLSHEFDNLDQNYNLPLPSSIKVHNCSNIKSLVFGYVYFRNPKIESLINRGSLKGCFFENVVSVKKLHCEIGRRGNYNEFQQLSNDAIELVNGKLKRKYKRYEYGMKMHNKTASYWVDIEKMHCENQTDCAIFMGFTRIVDSKFQNKLWISSGICNIISVKVPEMIINNYGGIERNFQYGFTEEVSKYIKKVVYFYDVVTKDTVFADIPFYNGMQGIVVSKDDPKLKYIKT